MGLTTTSPENIADHLRKIQHIAYNTSQDSDQASISLKNLGGEVIEGVTFRVKLPRLERGGYRVTGGRIVRTTASQNETALYVATDLEPHGSGSILIAPDFEREKLAIDVTQLPIEGSVHIFILDAKSNRLANTLVSIDGNDYTTDKNGLVAVDLNRGPHQVIAFKPGYDRARKTIEVNGRLYLIYRFFNKLFQRSA
jgi:hypothetical protein